VSLRTVILSQAKADAREIYEFLAKHSVQAADRFLHHLALTIEELRQSPDKGMHLIADAPELAPTQWRKVEGFPNHLIFFQVDSGRLLDMRVVHGSRNWTQFL
jgi:plasmid stabilization system protein ParE